MFDAIIGWIVAAGAAALAIWGVRWKVKADRAARQIDGYQKSSDKWQEDAAKRVEEVKRQAAGKAPIDPKARKDLE
jgi:cell division protein FtsB